MSKSTQKPLNKLISLIVGISLIFSHLNTSLSGTALAGSGIIPQPQAKQDLPQGLILKTSPYQPLSLNGLKVHPENPLKFDFLLEEGNTSLSEEELKQEAKKLIEYFLTCLTLPEDELWVNLSPYEKDKIIPEETGLTEMGKGLLEQDYLLKQLTSSLMYPETDIGKDFWQKVYQRAYQLFKTTKLPINTFNKVWIIPDKAIVYEDGDRVVIGENHLKVMLESDYLALKNSPRSIVHSPQTKTRLSQEDAKDINDFSSQIVKEVIIPAIEEEVNLGKNFATLRQMYSSFILATWFKKRLKEHLLSRAYVDKKRLKGVDTVEPALKEQVYEQYLNSYKEGVYNYIKSDYDPNMRKTIKRRYYSGGVKLLSSEKGFLFIPDVSSRIKKAWDYLKNTRIITVGLGLIGKGKPSSEGALTSPRRLSEYELMVKSLPDGTIEVGSVIERILNALYASKENNPVSYSDFIAEVIEGTKIDFRGEPSAKELITPDGKIPPIVKKIILAIKEIKKESYSPLPIQKEIVGILLEKITKSWTLQEGVISYVLEKIKTDFSRSEEWDIPYLKKVWNYQGTMGEFIKGLRLHFKDYLDGEIELKLDQTFLGGADSEAKEFLIRKYFIPVQLLLQYSPYLNIPSSFGEESKGDSFFEEYIKDFTGSISRYISNKGDVQALLHEELRKFVNNERLREDIMERADRLVLAMRRKRDKESGQFISAASPLTIDQLKAGVKAYLNGASFPFPLVKKEEAKTIILTYLSQEMDLSGAIEKLQALIEYSDVISLRANLAAIGLAQKYNLNFVVIGRFVTYLVRKARNLAITQESIDELKEGLRGIITKQESGKNIDVEPIIEKIIKEGEGLISASSSLTKGGIDFLDEKFFKLDTQGKGIDINYAPAKLQDFDISGLTIGEILIVNPKKN